MTSSIIPYYQKHNSIVEENLVLCEDPDDIEAIHNMRLSIKRIRVVGKLADIISDQTFDSKSRLKEINKFFKKSGRLRDTQVTKQLLVDFNDQNLTAVIDTFSSREKKQRSKFEVARNAFDKQYLDDFSEALAELLSGISEKKALACGNTLLNNLEGEIQEIFHSSADEKRMHDIRTRIKDINYLNNIFDEQLPVKEYMHIDIERLRELGDMAGAWHDNLNLEKIVRKYLAKNPDSAKLSALHKLQQELKQKKENLLQEYTCILLNEVRI